MSRRPLNRPRSSAFAYAGIGIALLAVACGNISLTGSPEGMGNAASPPVAALHPPDASADGGASSPGNTGAPSEADAGAVGDAGPTPTAIVGNPLCFYRLPGAHVCVPDTSESCAGGGASDDAGAYNPWADAGDGGDSAPAAPNACHVTNGTQMCSVAGAGQDGAQCQTGDDCAAMFECVGSPGRCRHYCCSGNATCDSALSVGSVATSSFCDVQYTSPSKVPVPVCVPVSGCMLLTAGACQSGLTCAVVKDDGSTSCVPVGKALAGEPCEGDGVSVNAGSGDPYHCAAGLTCLGAPGSRTCAALCHLDSPGDCAAGTTCTGSAQLFKDANVGICQ